MRQPDVPLLRAHRRAQRPRLPLVLAAPLATLLATLLALTGLPRAARADAPEIVAARAEGQVVYVTLAHPDTGWDHYADGWEVVTQDGTSLGLRSLAHPHVNEQPFTRSLALDAPLPDEPVFVRARCNVDGWGDALLPVTR